MTSTVTESTPPPLSATGDQRIFGQIVSLKRAGDHYELRLDPASFLTGVTANVAQAEDQGTPCAPTECPPVANDNYVVDEGHRAFTYLVPPGVHGTVLGKGVQQLDITVEQLADLVAGTSSIDLFEPLSTGIWILVHGDTVRTFAQQYRP